VIAHRLSTVKNAHCVCVLENGKVAIKLFCLYSLLTSLNQIVESGTHDQLLAQEGLYKRLVLRQLQHQQGDGALPAASVLSPQHAHSLSLETHAAGTASPAAPAQPLLLLPASGTQPTPVQPLAPLMAAPFSPAQSAFAPSATLLSGPGSSSLRVDTTLGGPGRSIL
jgi:hypothetical protein